MIDPRRAANQPPGTTQPEGHLVPGGPLLPETIRFTLEPFTTVLQGCTYRTEPKTILARRVAAVQPFPGSPSTVVEVPDPFLCSLRREAACWVLRFKDGCAFLKYEI